LENGYVTKEDIDRSLRNDGGYYLPFAGNFRYMDLMGTYIYGIVMKDLNPELSKDSFIPAFCQHLIDKGLTGMSGGAGFYEYGPGEAEEWERVVREFSYRIEEIISKYPFNHIEENSAVAPNHSS
ncbi:MAG TPA: 3-hydroxyacyl-CoA dehydrogenase family protein, partial [Chitinophagaceae bacterium]|nr:3-hydroxyacyl-CoA dehydrogenase family protein [Chitinophagaceae bacterium]